jgi:hypothetical protein
MSTLYPVTKDCSWDRREFIAAAAGAAAVAYLPFGSAAATPVVGASEPQALLADWSIDDQWGVYPRYDAIPSAPPHAEVDTRLAAVHPADLPFVV